MGKKIIITGATGLIGRDLCRILSERGDEVTVFTRTPDSAKIFLPFVSSFIKWNGKKSENYSDFINGKDAVIHLSGTNVVGSKWTPAFKEKIYSSRIESTNCLVDSISKCDKKPSVFICSSAIGIYGNCGIELVTEQTPAGDTFLSKVCFDWEKSAQRVEQFNVRRVSVRTGIVLNKNGGALAKMLPAFASFLGGPLGSGKQWFSWIHWQDLCNIFIFALDNNSICGAVNGVAPIAETSGEFAKTLGRIMKRPSFFNVPDFLLKLIMGEAVEAVLSSQRVIPTALNKAGFKFEFINADSALRNILEK